MRPAALAHRRRTTRRRRVAQQAIPTVPPRHPSAAVYAVSPRASSSLNCPKASSLPRAASLRPCSRDKPHGGPPPTRLAPRLLNSPLPPILRPRRPPSRLSPRNLLSRSTSPKIWMPSALPLLPASHPPPLRPCPMATISHQNTPLLSRQRRALWRSGTTFSRLWASA